MDRLVVEPESWPEATISTELRTEPETMVLSKLRITYLNIRWLARIEDGALLSTLASNWMCRFLKSFSVTPCTCSRMSATLKFVAAYANVPSEML